MHDFIRVSIGTKEMNHFYESFDRISDEFQKENEEDRNENLLL